MNKKVTRRSFLKSTAASSLSIPFIMSGMSSSVLGKRKKISPNGRLQHASIGVNGMGWSDLNAINGSGKVDIVAICDIDENNLNRAAKRFPHARKYRDWRELLEKEQDKIDSVNVTTPDHMHAPIAMSAVRRGKNVYCQKPLTHEVYECRQLTLAARKAGVVTQMGIQIHSRIEYRMAVKIIQDGVIGKIKEWHSWCNAPSWPQAMNRPAGSDPVPANIAWDLWLGVAPERPYKQGVYLPFKWRGWQDFGGGALGDFGCHIFDPPFTALEISNPLSIQAEVSGTYKETWPKWEVIHYEFAGSKYTAGKTIKATWSDGGKKPGKKYLEMMGMSKFPRGYGGSIIIGTEGVMLLPHIGGPQLFPKAKFKHYRRPRLGPQDHYHQWVDACLGHGKTSAGFDYSGPLAEAVLLGNIANRVPGKKLLWDRQALRFTNSPEATNLVRRNYRSGWHIKGLG